jgi:Zn-dependent M28 family amino/carboxypeptidase
VIVNVQRAGVCTDACHHLGSGTAANLVLATNLARLYRTTDYVPFPYRVRFCWWGAEEIGLAGSTYHIDQAKAENRLNDYLVNLNFDMAASPNFIFGIYDAKTASNETPASALTGSRKVSELYRDWFIDQQLPWDYRALNGRSDYGPFLAAGIAAGGVATGSDTVKTNEQHKKYLEMLGIANAGFSGAILDPCYHLACDHIDNIHQYGYEKLIQAAAYGLEYLGRKPNLRQWLYPTGQ